MRRLWLAALAVVVLAGPAFANPIFIPPAKPPLVPLIVVLDYAVDLFFILVALALLRIGAQYPLRRILAVGAAAMVGGFIADGVGGAVTDRLLHWLGPAVLAQGTDLFSYTARTNLWSFLGRVIIPIPIIFAVNYVLGRRFLGLSRRQGILLGLVVGVCTTPILYTALEQFGVEWVGGIFGLYEAGGQSPLLDSFTPRAFAVAAILFGLADVILLERMKRGVGARRFAVAAPVAALVVAFGLGYMSALGYIPRPLSHLDACRRNLAEINLALLMYENDWEGYPPNLDAIDPYYMSVRPMDVRHCPADPMPRTVLSYTYRKPPAQVGSPGEFWLVRCDHHPHPTDALYLCVHHRIRSGPK